MSHDRMQSTSTILVSSLLRVLVFLINRCSTKALKNFRTPFEVWFFRRPSIDHLRVFGCLAYRLIRKELRSSKYTQVSSAGALVGYDQDNFNYHVYDIQDRKVYITPHVSFNEEVFPFASDVPSSQVLTERVRSFYFDDNNEVIEPAVETNCDKDQNLSDEIDKVLSIPSPESSLQLTQPEVSVNTPTSTPTLPGTRRST